MTLMENRSTAQTILDDLDDGLERGSIPASIFGNAELYQQELRKVFSRAWVFLAHESEIAAEGDYVVRKIGQDNFIVSRDDAGNVQVMLDACRRRGMPRRVGQYVTLPVSVPWVDLRHCRQFGGCAVMAERARGYGQISKQSVARRSGRRTPGAHLRHARFFCATVEGIPRRHGLVSGYAFWAERAWR